MNVLAELHQEPGLKLNLKFEIEVLCKHLCLDITVSNLERFGKWNLYLLSFRPRQFCFTDSSSTGLFSGPQ